MMIFDRRKIRTQALHSASDKPGKGRVLLKHNYISALSAKECNMFIKENLDLIYFNYGLGLDCFSGYVIFGFFYITFFDRRIYQRYPVLHKAIGRIKKKNGKTMITLYTYRGITDIFPLSLIFIALFVLLGAFTYNLALVKISTLAFFGCLAAAVVFFFYVNVSKKDMDGKEELLDLLERCLELKQID